MLIATSLLLTSLRLLESRVFKQVLCLCRHLEAGETIINQLSELPDLSPYLTYATFDYVDGQR